MIELDINHISLLYWFDIKSPSNLYHGDLCVIGSGFFFLRCSFFPDLKCPTLLSFSFQALIVLRSMTQICMEITMLIGVSRVFYKSIHVSFVRAPGSICFVCLLPTWLKMFPTSVLNLLSKSFMQKSLGFIISSRPLMFFSSLISSITSRYYFPFHSCFFCTFCFFP